MNTHENLPGNFHFADILGVITEYVNIHLYCTWPFLAWLKGCGKLFNLSVEDFLVYHEVNGNFAIGSRMNQEFYIAFSDSFYFN